MRRFDAFDAERRRFLQSASLAGLASLLAPAMVEAQAKSAAQAKPLAPGPKHADSTAAPPAAPKPPEISDDARALAEILKRRYGQHLEPQQVEAVTREIENRLQGGKTLRAAKLANADEPDFTFHA